MFKRTLLVVIGLVAAPVVSAQEKPPSPEAKEGQPRVKYEAEREMPKDKSGEKRRDYAVLEAALTDLTDPKNPEHKYHIQNVGPGREIVIDEVTYQGKLGIDLGRRSHSVDGKDARRIPDDVRADFHRHDGEPARSLADFKPANPNIIVHDLDKMFEDADDPIGEFQKKYPTAWGYVWAYPPGYSKDGQSALLVFEGGPNGDHGLNWIYMLIRKGNRWEVEWRHCRLRK